MKIAFIVDKFPSLSQTFILNQVTGLLDRGHEVDIYASERGSTSKVHPAVENYHLCDRTYYLPQIPENLLGRVFKGIGLLLANGYKDPGCLLKAFNVFKYRLLPFAKSSQKPGSESRKNQVSGLF
ncbi:MAG: hypothetical protein RID09_30270 [Coleofasciculus sp. G1-WW12-02]